MLMFMLLFMLFTFLTAQPRPAVGALTDEAGVGLRGDARASELTRLAGARVFQLLTVDSWNIQTTVSDT